MKIETCCKGCVFAKYEDDSQVGCELGRVELMNPSGEGRIEDGVFNYVFKRFCNAYRPEGWKDVLSKEEKKDTIATVKKETRPTMCAFVFLNTQSEDALNDLRYTVGQLKVQEDADLRCVVIINPKVEYNGGIQEILASEFDFNKTEHHIVLSLREQEDLFLIDDAFSHAKNGWILVTESGEAVPPSLFSRINKKINIDMKRLVLVKPYENWNGMIFQAAIYKFLDGNKMLIDPETREAVEINFLEKIEMLASESEDSDSIYEWEDFLNDTP